MGVPCLPPSDLSHVSNIFMQSKRSCSMCQLSVVSEMHLTVLGYEESHVINSDRMYPEENIYQKAFILASRRLLGFEKSFYSHCPTQ